MATPLSPAREPAAAHRGITSVPRAGAAHRPPTRRRRPAEPAPTEPRRQQIPLGSPPVPAPRPPSAPSDDGRDVGLSLLISFLAAALLMVGAVVTVGVVNRSWVLVPVMVVDLAATFCVLATIARLLRDDAGAG
jgi:hypothetical protein